MPLQIVSGDITQFQTDAIVNAANSRLARGNGVCGAIHRAAGDELEKECLRLGGCSTGDAKITGGYHLPAKHVIHAVGPIWQGGHCNEESLLASCYRRSLQLCEEHHLKSVAFPLISAGIYGYPKKDALRVAIQSIEETLNSFSSSLEVFLVLFDPETLRIAQDLVAIV